MAEFVLSAGEVKGRVASGHVGSWSRGLRVQEAGEVDLQFQQLSEWLNLPGIRPGDGKISRTLADRVPGSQNAAWHLLRLEEPWAGAGLQDLAEHLAGRGHGLSRAAGLRQSDHAMLMSSAPGAILPSMPGVARDTSLDAMRVLAAFAVVMVHVAGSALSPVPTSKDTVWWLANIMDACSRWCVPAFVMVSGALLLTGQPSTAREFYSRRLHRLLTPTIAWTLVYIAIRYKAQALFEIADIIRTILAGMPGTHLWYLYMSIGLYAIIPALKQYVHNSPPRDIAVTAAIAMATSIALDVTNMVSQNREVSFLLVWPSYVGYLLVGYCIHTSAPRINWKLALLGFFAFGTTTTVAAAFSPTSFTCEQWLAIVYSYLSPLVVGMTICVFATVQTLSRDTGNTRYGRLATAISPYTLGIYLVHPIVLRAMDRMSSVSLPVLRLIAMPAIVFVCSLAITWTLSRIPMLRRTVI